MRLQFLNYPEWQETADTLHLFLQMAGKVKVMRSVPRPEWAHVRLYLTTEGLSTGLIPADRIFFTILFDFHSHQVEFCTSEGEKTAIRMKNGLSVAAFYEEFYTALRRLGVPTAIDPRPQEFYEPINFDRDEKHRTYDKEAVALWHNNLLFASRALMKYVSAFRGKVDYPAYYFGTMDLTCVVYSGEPAPYQKRGPVMPYAFDERFVECGFWPGDAHFLQPAFYVMPYPFLAGLDGYEKDLQPEKAFFKPEKKEFFLTLEDALSYSDPVATVAGFCRKSFDIVQQIHPWKQLEWITKPLEYPSHLK